MPPMRAVVSRAAIRGAIILLAAAPSNAFAVAPQGRVSEATIVAQLSTLRAAFMRRIDEEGYRLCAAPRLERDDAPGLTRYLPERDAIVIGAGVAAPQAAPLPEYGDYAWSFVHELSHWWQDCRRQARPRAYGAEAGANRIALAFWRERRPRFAQAVVQRSQDVLQAIGDPLPAGESAQAYLAAHAEAPVDDGTARWLQAQMIATLAREQPAPSFHKALSQPLYPW